MRFKVGGYTDTGADDNIHIPLSAQAQLTHAEPETARNPSMHGGDTRITEADAWLAGKLLPHVGALIRVQHTHGGGSTSPPYTALTDVDVRFAKEIKLELHPLTWGLTLNNHPGLTDPSDALPAWGFGGLGPGRDFATGTLTGTLLNHWQGGLANRVLGLTGYGFFDEHWYAEIGSYRSLSMDAQHRLGLPQYRPGETVGDPGRLSNTLYWRMSYLHDFKTQFFSVGLIGLSTRLQPLNVQLPSPEREGPSDGYKDLGVDAIYEYLGNRDHVLQLRANYIHEKRDYGSTPPNPFFPPQLSLPQGTVEEAAFSATYFFKNTWGITVAHTSSKVSDDPARFLPYGKSNTDFTFIGPMWTVWGKEDATGPLGSNLQLGLVWVRFDKFNGSKTAIFGNSPFVTAADSKDLNQILLYAKLAI